MLILLQYCRRRTTAGLVLVSRLSEQPSFSLLVLEAGKDHANDITVKFPGVFAARYANTEFDWNYCVLLIEVCGQQAYLSHGVEQARRILVPVGPPLTFVGCLAEAAGRLF